MTSASIINTTSQELCSLPNTYLIDGNILTFFNMRSLGRRSAQSILYIKTGA